ncbi:MAG: hypothetical protein NTZ05_19720 [Chloroflexi bacterium]|nr:hypothetical protein [Chloroflexota bacterium]
MILPEWETALKLHLRRRARVNWAMYDTLIQKCLERLREQTHDIPDLRAHYGRGAFWALQMARREFPQEPPMKWDPHLFADAAYGYRYRELTGEAITAADAAGGNDDDDAP